MKGRLLLHHFVIAIGNDVSNWVLDLFREQSTLGLGCKSFLLEEVFLDLDPGTPSLRLIVHGILIQSSILLNSIILHKPIPLHPNLPNLLHFLAAAQPKHQHVFPLVVVNLHIFEFCLHLFEHKLGDFYLLA